MGRARDARVGSRARGVEGERAIEEGRDAARRMLRAMDIPRMMQLVRAEDWDAIEGARDRVRGVDLEALLPEYWQLEGWMQKIAFANLVQDQAHPALRAIMLDVLRAPRDRNGDVVELTKAVALGFVDEQYDTFMRFYEDRRALHAAVREVLEAHGMTEVDDGPRAAPRPIEPAPVPSDPAEALMHAAVYGDVEKARALLDAGLDPDLGRTQDTPLLAACVEAQEEVAVLLLERGASATATRVADQTALFWAAIHGLRTLAAKLVERGADVNRADRWGGVPLHEAAKGNHVELVRELIGWGASPRAAYSDDRSPVWFAVYHGRTEAALALLDAGLDVNEPVSGSTLLSLAAGENHPELVRALLARGADPNLRNEGGLSPGLTPLMVAAARSYPRIVRILLEAGADRDARAIGGRADGKRAIELARGRRADEVRAVLEA